MKKVTLLLFCGLFSAGLFAQEQDFNRWSIELEAGVHKPARPMAGGYYTSTPSFFQGSLGARYMITNRFGLKASVGYNAFEGKEDESQPFKSNYMRGTLEGVVNAGNILNFRNWSQSLNLLVHGGMGYAQLNADEPVEFEDPDNMYHFIAGITPQLRISDHIALTGDFSVLVNAAQDHTFDGTNTTNTRGFNGYLLNGSLGLTFYLGSAEKHADWYEGVSNDVLDSLDTRISKIEDDMLDSDQDGVPNYLDQEPNTTNGVAVNTKGAAVDNNSNGIPDELEASLDERYASTTGETTTGGGMIADLLNKGYVNVYFQFNSTEPETYSLEAINYCITYMRENTGAQADLIGYADEIGDPDYNATLSEARAQTVYDIMVAAGIDAARLNVVGNGEDASVDKASKPARQLVRRVTFRLK